MPRPDFTSLSEAAAWFETWLAAHALPLWASAGVEAGAGAFFDALTPAGAPVPKPRRARVQARQVFVYATVARSGFGGEWLKVAQRGFDHYRAHYRRPDGQFAILTDESGRVIDDTPRLYEQAFSLLAMAALTAAGDDHGDDAERLLSALQGRRHGAGGFREFGEHPFQANAHMHLLEAALTWEQLTGGQAWRAFADEVVDLCVSRFIDPQGGYLHEFFDENWRPAPGDAGRWVEPGHQFEWAWLLAWWGRLRGDPAARPRARKLFEQGLRGVDPARGVAVNVLWDDLSVRDAGARLWPQTEYLKTALLLGAEAEALRAAKGLASYLDVPLLGAWRDKLDANGVFAAEPAPASSFYHIAVAILELRKAIQAAAVTPSAS